MLKLSLCKPPKKLKIKVLTRISYPATTMSSKAIMHRFPTWICQYCSQIARVIPKSTQRQSLKEDLANFTMIPLNQVTKANEIVIDDAILAISQFGPTN